MRELNPKELTLIGGAGDPLTDENSQLIRQIMVNFNWSVAFGIARGFPGMAAAGALAVTQTVVQGAMARMPVNVPIPNVPMGPVWNGSK